MSLCIESLWGTVRARVLVAVATSALLVSCASNSPALPERRLDAVSRDNIYASARKPQSPADLLENIRTVANHHLLLREDFYTDENLKRFFGAQTITRATRESPSRLTLFLSDFGGIVEPVQTGSLVFEGIAVYVSNRMTEQDKKEATLTLNVRSNSRLNFDDVVRIFGKDWKPPRTIDPNRVNEPPPTSPRGNYQIEYETAGADVISRIRIRFGPDGTLNTLSLQEIK